jgi:hypothetical protein
MGVNPNIFALQAAENLLRLHDARIAEAAAEVKKLRAERKDLADRVQQCIDVLCGRATPDLFAGAEAQTERVPTPGETAGSPVVCDPVGAGLLRDIPGITREDADRMAAVGLTTLAVLAAECGDDLDNAAGLLESWVEEFTRGDADRIAKAIERHLKPGTVPPESKGVVYPPSEDWRDQGLALLGLNEKLLKACKREEVLTLGDLHDWIDEGARQLGGFFGESGAVLVNELARVGKIATKWAKANADILFQFFADKGFVGVPTKEEVAAHG